LILTPFFGMIEYKKIYWRLYGLSDKTLFVSGVC
jgi:hypothetical protein